MAEDPLLEQALTALRGYDRKQAREVLTRLIKADPKNIRYWLWLSTAVDTPKEIIYCLQEILKLDPNHPIAVKGLTYFGVLKAEKNAQNLFTEKKDWQTDLRKKIAPVIVPKTKKPARDTRKLIVSALGGALIIGFIVLAAIFIPRLTKPRTQVITINRPTSKPTATYLPTNTPFGYKPSPTPVRPTPLSNLLEQTYTPTPLYVVTPHNTEAYTMAMKAYLDGEWDLATYYFEQAIEAEPGQADLFFYLGEIERQQGAWNEALRQYEKAMNLNTSFPAAMLAHAQVLQKVKPDTFIIDDLNEVIAADPSMVEAYIERAYQFLNRANYDEALKDLSAANDLRPDSAIVYSVMAQVYLSENMPELALENAKKAYAADKTMIDNYLILGSAYIANGQMEASIDPLEIYLSFHKKDFSVYAKLGIGYFAAGNIDKAMENLNEALRLEPKQYQALVTRGIIRLDEGKLLDSVEDFTDALKVNDNGFDAVYYRGKAYMALRKYYDAYNQYLRAENLAPTPIKKAECIYLQAKAATARGDRAFYIDSWTRLLAEPAENMPIEWRIEAELAITPCDGDACIQRTATYDALFTPTP